MKVVVTETVFTTPHDTDTRPSPSPDRWRRRALLVSRASALASPDSAASRVAGRARAPHRAPRQKA
eukprot:4274738-Prymnesium_polylepis.1